MRGWGISSQLFLSEGSAGADRARQATGTREVQPAARPRRWSLGRRAAARAQTQGEQPESTAHSRNRGDQKPPKSRGGWQPDRCARDGQESDPDERTVGGPRGNETADHGARRGNDNDNYNCPGRCRGRSAKPTESLVFLQKVRPNSYVSILLKRHTKSSHERYVSMHSSSRLQSGRWRREV